MLRRSGKKTPRKQESLQQSSFVATSPEAGIQKSDLSEAGDNAIEQGEAILQHDAAAQVDAVRRHDVVEQGDAVKKEEHNLIKRIEQLESAQAKGVDQAFFLLQQIQKLEEEAIRLTDVDRAFRLVQVASLKWDLAQLRYPNDVSQLEAARREVASAKWNLAKSEYPFDVAQLEAARSALIDAEVAHAKEKATLEWSIKLENLKDIMEKATGDTKMKFAEELHKSYSRAADWEKSWPATEIELRKRLEAAFALPSTTLIREVDARPIVEKLIGEDLPSPPPLSKLGERLERPIPAVYPVESHIIRKCRALYDGDDEKVKEIEDSKMDEFFFLKSSTSERLSVQYFGIEPLLWDWDSMVKGQSEDATHAAITPLVQRSLDWIMRYMDVSWPFDYSFSRNQTEVKRSRTSLEETRPDWMFHIRGILVFRGEEKGDSSKEPAEALVNELVTKMDAWNPFFFGDLEYVFGYALNGMNFQLCALYPDKSITYPEGACGVRIAKIGACLTLSKIAHRAKLLQYIFNMAKIFKAMEQMLPQDGPYLEQKNPYWKREGSGEYSRILFFLRYVRKTLVGNGQIKYDYRLLKSLYAKVKDGSVKNTIRCDDKYPQVDGSDIILHLYPLGKKDRKPTSDAELVTFVKDILVALDSLHDAGFCHRDVRWPNVIQKMDGHWLLIDLDFCALLDKKNGHAPWPEWTNGVPRRHGKEMWTRQHDLKQLAQMIRDLNLASATSVATKVEHSQNASLALSSLNL